MRRIAMAATAATILLAFGAGTVAQAQEPLRFSVKPRSWLDPGRAVQPGYSPNPASAQGQMISYMINPPYANMRDRFGEGTLPDPIGGPFVGATNLLGPVDYNGLYNYSVHDR